MNTRKSLSRGIAAVTAATAALVLAPAALAQGVNYTWLGTGTTQDWSDAGNWTASDSSMTAPSATVGTLSFPNLTCGGSPDPCTGYDDVSPLTADELVIDTSTNYQQYESGSYGSEPITLGGNGALPNIGLITTYGNAGVAGSNPTAVFELPILLTGSAQEWDVAQGNLYATQISDASGQSTPLTVNLGASGNYGYLEVGQIATSGTLAVQGNGDLGLAYGSGLPSPSLPAVTLSGNTDLTIATNATSGGIDATGDTGDVQVYGIPGSVLTIGSGNLTLGANSGIDLDVDGSSASLSDSVDVTNGRAILGGATLALYQNEQTPYTTCNTLTPGATVTLLSASGGITGSLMVGGHTITSGGSATVPITNECGGSPATAIVSYNTRSITAMVAGAPAAVAGQTPQIAGGTTLGDTLTSSTGAWTGGPAPTYSYQWLANGSAIAGATGSSYTLTSAEVGQTITLAVTASNAYGNATADSNAVGPVTAAASTTTTTTTTTTATTPSPTITITPALVRTALARLAHPSGKQAISLLLAHGLFKTSFRAPAPGTLSVVWTATVTTGKGKHAKHDTYVVARGKVRAGAAGLATVTIRLTGAGRRLVRKHRSSLSTTARERFLVSGSGRMTVTRRFTL